MRQSNSSPTPAAAIVVVDRHLPSAFVYFMQGVGIVCCRLAVAIIPVRG